MADSNGFEMTRAKVGIYLRGGQSLMPQQGFCSNFSMLIRRMGGKGVAQTVAGKGY